MSKFARALIPEPPRTAAPWLLTFVLNSLDAKLESPPYAHLLNFMRLTEAAFRDYVMAREQTERYLHRPPTSDDISDYMAAVHGWEVFLADADHALVSFSMNSKILFTKGDGSLEGRLRTLYNESKHSSSVVQSGLLPAGSTLSMWLESDGLHSLTSHVTFEELAGILNDLGNWADATQNPATAYETLKALIDTKAVSADSSETVIAAN